MGKVAVLTLAVVGLVAIYRTATAPPDVGHFRTQEGKSEYQSAYAAAMRELPPPTATHDIDTRFGTVRAYEWSNQRTKGEQPVVLIPGRSSGVPMWQANVSDFAQHRRVIAFDALGDAGLSVQSVPLANMTNQAAWIHDVLSRLAPHGAHVVGHSFGGTTAAAYAMAYPTDVASLALLEPVFTFAYPPPSMMWWSIVASLPFLPEGVRENALAHIGGEDDDGEDPLARMIAAGAKHYSAELPTPRPLSEEDGRRLTMPVYVAIAGADSVAGGEGAAQRARAILPAGVVQTWPTATHSLPMQEADALVPVLQRLWNGEH